MDPNLSRVCRTAKRSLLKLETELAASESPTVGQIEAYKTMMAEVKDIFEKAQTKLEQQASEEELEATWEQRDIFESTILRINAYLINQTMVNDPNSSMVSNSHNIRLPKLTLPKFDGDSIKWPEFKDLFNTAVGQNFQLTEVEKLQYLKSTLVGEAAEVVRSLQLIEANYCVAWKLLSERFENKRLNAFKLYQRLFSINKMERDPTSLQKMVSELTKINESIKALKWDSYNNFLLFSIYTKLDEPTKNAFEMSLQDNEIPEVSTLINYLAKKTAATQMSHGHRGQRSLHVNLMKAQGDNSPSCLICSNSHSIHNCSEFLNLSCNERFQKIKGLRLCINCLGRGHFVKECRSIKCKKCSKAYHTLLHQGKENKSDVDTTQPRAREDVTVDEAIGIANVNCENLAMLSTALLLIKDAYGTYQTCRALIDNGAQASFISEELVRQLQLKRQSLKMLVKGVNGNQIGKTHGFVTTKISSRVNECKYQVKLLIMPKLVKIEGMKWPIALDQRLVDKPLADPHYYKPGYVDVIIGSDLFIELLQPGKISSAEGPSSFNSSLGWLLTGKAISKQISVGQVSLESINEIVERFWKSETIPEARALTAEERDCEAIYDNTTTRNLEGRYIVKLPLRVNQSLGDSKYVALRRAQQLQRKVQSKPEIQASYTAFMDEYLNLGHMERCKNEDFKPCYYLPHHIVLNPNSTTTKLRVVFDGSAQPSNGVSLNESLMVGPTLQDDLFSIIIRFRFHKIAIIADLEKMYRQILIQESDTHLQRIFWENQCYKLLTVSYGTASASYLAIKTLYRLVQDEGQAFPLASKVIRESFYVDDLISSFNTMEEAKKVVSELNELLKKGGFLLRKWISNDAESWQVIPEVHRGTPTMVDLGCGNSDSQVRALGILWNPSNDKFSFKPNEKACNPVTKRNILSMVASTYDPLGILGPLVISSKILLQDLWIASVQWDDVITDADILKNWDEIKTNFVKSETISISRSVNNFEPGSQYEVHGFSDASSRAMAAVVYIRVISGDVFSSNILCAKTKVAPLKTISIPRLELCAAVLLVKLVNKIKESLRQFGDTSYFYWTDSTNVLAWIGHHLHHLKVFEANRVSFIQESSRGCDWRHVPSSSNPADIASRGCNAEQLVMNKLWWNGPEWLVDSEESWPRLKAPEVMTLNLMSSLLPLVPHIETNPELGQLSSILQRYSSFSKLRRVIAYCLRFIHNSKSSPKDRVYSSLSTQELNQAVKCIVKSVQSQSFSCEMDRCRKGQSLKANCKLITLNPFLDDDDILRVGGRLHHSSLCFEGKHPIILPARHQFSELIIDHTHRTQLHSGASLTLSIIRQRFWLVSNPKEVVKKIIRKCLRCRRFGKSSRQIMGDLPASRINPSRPFLRTGVDYAGPFFCRQVGGRARTNYKCYLAIFVCMSIKAVHLELVSDLTTECFIASFRRFVGRRGLPTDVYSDNGTNFKGAKNLLAQLIIENQPQISHFAGEQSIQWHFIPPVTPHMGGLWEAAVRSAKHHLQRVIGAQVLTFEELSTLLVQVEAALNSRPLCRHDDDPSALVLTPGHFLIGAPLVSVPDRQEENVKINYNKRWRFVQILSREFWKGWSREYLHTLQERTKWQVAQENLKVDDLVIVKDQASSPMNWSIGQVVSVYPGEDTRVRVVDVKTTKGVFNRSIQKLIKIY